VAKFLLWCILLFLCWPLALVALVLYPLVWLLLLPFRLLGIRGRSSATGLGAVTLPAGFWAGRLGIVPNALRGPKDSNPAPECASWRGS